MKNTLLLFLLILTTVFSCKQKPTEDKQTEAFENHFTSKNPWPEIRKKRIQELLPSAMERAEVEAWIVICRENNNDPMAIHIGGENAGGTSFYLFYKKGDELNSAVFSSFGEVTALTELGLHDSIISVSRGQDVFKLATDFVKEISPNKIAINTSSSNSTADGLSHSQYQKLTNSFGQEWEEKLISSEALVYEWLSIKLPEEVEILRKAAEITAQWELEAYKTIVPGKTTDAEVADFLNEKIKTYGFEDGWNPEQNPNVNSGPDRGHSHATDKVIMPGDVIQTDFGIKVYGIWVTDIQRFAYVLKEDEEKAPENIQQYWDVAKRGHRIVFENMKPGISGYELDQLQRQWMKENGSLSVPWSTGHPVGYVAHDVGPSIGGGQEGIIPSETALKPLKWYSLMMASTLGKLKAVKKRFPLKKW
ncbi:M24 family metallopeptidase [uncultured Marivirga sp.]|uniref:M24 family metallopeptidase n=1 Tax=uncultured Marivirga sp. TaxID=1123707 RepID=UPI0030EE94E2|tara:strand:- start:48619 stop:49878 length:1260 start_codon:yes stop_codon:yes gene_type:complete